MINTEQIEEILKLYRKYGWTLRRVLLTDALQTQIRDQLENLFGAAVAFVSSEVDALWFTRVLIDGGETWELRHLNGNPFALVEVFDEEEDETVRDERLHELESELRERIEAKIKKPETSH